METVLVTGGTGLIGTALTGYLMKQGYKVKVLTRSLPSAITDSEIEYVHWDINKMIIDEKAIRGTDHVIHLAGANVADGRWTAGRKREIVHSRVASGTLLVKAIREIPNRIKTVISASAIGWYGPDPAIPNPKPFTETVGADASFLGKTCQQWEAAICPVKEEGKRLVIFRIGIILSRKGGAYAEFRKPLRFGLASVLGSGKQVISWIHIDDMIRLFEYALKNTHLSGVYNAAAPQPVSNRQLIIQMAREKGGPFVTVPVPVIFLKTLLGEMSVEVLKSATVSSDKLIQAGFSFNYPTLGPAIKNLEQIR